MIPKKLDEVIRKMKLREDRAFVRSRLSRLRPEMMANVLKEYIRLWREGVDLEPMLFRKQNAGRRAANLFLLNY